MEQQEIIGALENLGARLTSPLEITIAGGAALILAHGLRRATVDAEDLQDLADLKPSSDEIQFVRDNLEHIAQSQPEKAQQIKLYMEEGDWSQ